jgi:hypothetical protein
MALQLFDQDLSLITVLNPLRSSHDGHKGEAHEQVVYVRNLDAAKYYTTIALQPENIGAYDDSGEFGTTGWSVKLLYGSRQPTEAEWDGAIASAIISLPDIGSTEAADTFTNHPVWVRVYCPGSEPVQIRENVQLKLRYFERNVGA